jgi:hypothetical protein
MATQDKTGTRTESDTFGPIEVENSVYWGAQSQRSIGNFKIGWEKQPKPIIRALGIIKKAAAETNHALGRLDGALKDTIVAAAEEVIAGIREVGHESTVLATVDDAAFVLYSYGSGAEVGEVRGLRAGASYSARLLDPRTGALTQLPSASGAGSSGAWRLPSKPDAQDWAWVLVLE